jgi:uncharacterized membrane protein YphA (DoxX/SURF4 family)
MLSASFITAGVFQLRYPQAAAKRAEGFAKIASGAIPMLPEDPVIHARINGAAQLGAGLLLALGKFPRSSAITLAVSLIPTTAGGHRFWEESDPRQRAEQQTHFVKNVGLLGGLLLAAWTANDRSGRATS